METSGIEALPAFNEKGELNIIIETTQGSANKLKWDAAARLFKLSGVLPSGSVFPYDFGFVPGTCGDDGDPLDVLLLMDQPVPPGCLVESRLIGVIEAEQTEDGETVRNDRLLAVSVDSRNHRHVQEITDLEKQRLDEIEHFFISYNQIKGKEFKPLARRGSKGAMLVVKRAETGPADVER